MHVSENALIHPSMHLCTERGGKQKEREDEREELGEKAREREGGMSDYVIRELIQLRQHYRQNFFFLSILLFSALSQTHTYTHLHRLILI